MTGNELAALDFICDRLARSGLAPTYREIGEKVGVTASGARYIALRLDANGLIRRSSGRYRGLALAPKADLRGHTSDALRAELARRGETIGALDKPERTALGRGSVACAADCCTTEVQRGHLYCRSHYFSLPHGLRQRILSAFGRKDVSAYQEAFQEAQARIDGSWKGDR